MAYNTIKYNDTANCPGVGVSIFFQGCPHHCEGCFNPETWSFEGGKPFTHDTIWDIEKHLIADGVKRGLNILGGEPLCPQNQDEVMQLISWCKLDIPDLEIYLWTGYTLEELRAREDRQIDCILRNITCLIDGRYEQDKKDITLPLRGSSNQRVIYLNI